MDVSFVDEEGSSSQVTFVARNKGEPAKSERPLLKGNSKKSLFGHHVMRALTAMAGELVGTFLLTLVICSVVAASVASGAQVGLWQVAVVCGLGVAVSIYTTAHLSDAHLNPAITVAFTVVRWRTFSWKRTALYIVSQLVGGVLAGGVMYALFGRAIGKFEAENGIERGSNESVLSAMLFGEYFPNPAVYNHSLPGSYDIISPLQAMAVEAFCTGVLAFVIFSLTDRQNSTVGGGSGPVLVPLLIGLTVSMLISICGTLTQVGMNPARDFGPRVVAVLAGWGSVAIPGPRNGFWVYIVGPMLGALAGAGINDWIMSNFIKLTMRLRASEADGNASSAENVQEQ